MLYTILNMFSLVLSFYFINKLINRAQVAAGKTDIADNKNKKYQHCRMMDYPINEVIYPQSSSIANNFQRDYNNWYLYQHIISFIDFHYFNLIKVFIDI